MYVTNKNISLNLKKLGLNINTKFYYCKNNICIKLSNNNFLIIDEKNKSSKILQYDDYIPTFTLSEINFILKYYDKYFTSYYDITKNKWYLNKNIFKLYFLNYSKRKYIDFYKNKIDIEYDTEIDSKSNLLYFLIKTDFISINDINNYHFN
jgi:hypothetical protein